MNKHIADNIKVVFFDHDDTLFNTIGTKWAQHKHIARTFYKKELADDEIKEHWGKPLRELVCLLYGTDDVEQAMAYTTANHEDFPKKVFTATIPVLRHIKTMGKLIGIITATSQFSFEHDLTLHKVPKKLIDYTQSADDTSFHKPDPRVFKPALKWLAKQSIDPNEVIYIGDGLHDMQASIGVGFNFLGVETGLVSAQQFRAKHAKSIKTIADLLK